MAAKKKSRFWAKLDDGSEHPLIGSADLIDKDMARLQPFHQHEWGVDGNAVRLQHSHAHNGSC